MIKAIAHPVEIYKKVTWFLKTEWRWRIRANNGKIVGSSSEGYRNKKDMKTNMASVAASLNEYLTEEEGGVDYSNAKVTLNRKNE